MKHSREPARVASLIILLSALASVGFAQAKRPMTIVDLLNLASLRDPQLSPDGSQLLYVLSQADWEKNKRVSHIWRVNTDGTDAIQMTNGAEGEGNPRWSPDGKLVAFVAKRDETKGEEDDNEQVFLIRSEGGEAWPLTRHETAVSSIEWSPDGAFIYFLAAEPKSKEEKERDEVKDDVFAFDENYKNRHLWKVSLADGTGHRVTEGDFSVLRLLLAWTAARSRTTSRC